MSIKLGPEGVDFQGKRAVHGQDALHDTDLVTLRQLKRAIRTFSGITGNTSIVSIGDGYPVYAGYNGSEHEFRSFSAITPNLYMVCGDTITYGLSDYLIITGLTATTITTFELSATTLSAVNIDAQYYYSAGTPLSFTFREKIWCASTGTEAIIRNNYTNNIAAGNFSINAGAYSYSNGHFSIIAGGSGNTLNGNYGVIGGGVANKQYGLYSIVGGGSYNLVSGTSSFVGAGFGNRNYKSFSSILGGFGNYNKGTSSAILGGNFNTALTSYSSVFGSTNLVAAPFAVNTGGYRNKIYNIYGFIGNGLQNTIHSGASFSSILNGENNLIRSGSTLSAILNGSGNSINYNLSNTAILGGHSLSALSSNTIYSDHIVARSLTAASTSYVFADPDGHLILGSAPIINFTGSGLTSIVNTGLTHGVLAGIYDTIAVLKSLSGGSNIIITSSNTENAIYLSPNVYINSLYVSGNTILSATTAMTMTVLNLSGVGTQMVVTDNNGNLSTQPIPSGGTGGTTYYIENTGLTHGIYVGMSGSNVFILKSLSAGSNLDLFSSSTVNSFALKNNININGLTAVTITAGTVDAAIYLSAGTPLNFYERIWTASTGSNAIIRNNNTNNLASGTHAWVSGRANSATTTHAFIAQGFQNRATGVYSFIGNGNNNYASVRNYTTILNGKNNNVSGLYATILGGHDQRVSSVHGTIVNGDNNLVSSNYSSVLNGRYNSAVTSTYAIILGGSSGLASGNKSFIGNGTQNNVSSARGFIGNGNLNTALTSSYTTILNGSGNTSSGLFSVVINGKSNSSTNTYSIVVNGFKNTASGIKSIVINGSANTASATYSLVFNGISNIASNNNSFVILGRYNIASGSQSLILNGVSNQGLGYKSSIINGFTNLINSNSTYGFIAQGKNHIISASSNSSSVINGDSNKIYSSVFATSLNGRFNSISSSSQSSILNGDTNSISTYGIRSIIGNGSGNTITNNFSSVLNGFRNSSTGSYSTIVSGKNNRVEALHSFISNGSNLKLDSSAIRSAIIGGQDYTGTTQDMVYVPGLTVFGITSSLVNTDVATLNSDGRLFRTPLATIASSVSLLTSTSAINTGSTHGIYVSSFSGNSGSTTLVFKSLSGGNNIIINSSSTENSIALASNISLNSVSANTFYSGSTVLNLDNLLSSYWTAGTGLNSLLRNNNTGNIADGYFSFIVGANSSVSSGSYYSSILNAANSQIITSNNSTIIAGQNNQINYFSIPTKYSTILNGKNGYIRGSYSSILNGSYNSISYYSTKSTILNGSTNVINQNSSYNSIINGKGNYILFNTSYSFILNGTNNSISPYLTKVSIINGTGIIATESNATHVEKLFIHNTVLGGDRLLTIDSATNKVYYLTSFVTGATNIGNTHGVLNTINNGNLELKSLSGGSNILITSSSTENSIALSNNIILDSISATSISATTYYSGGTNLSTVISNNINSNFRASGVNASNFAGTPQKATITFANAFSDNDYAVTITGEDERSWTIESKSSSGFIINSNSNSAPTGTTFWISQKFYI